MSALALRILACVCMLLDHIGYSCPGWHFLRYIGRLAFPIFVFLMVNGYLHTSSRLRYALRFGLFALISQIPFTLFCGYDSFFQRGNIFFTLLCALLMLWATDSLLKGKLTRWFAFLPGLFATAVFFFNLFPSDYGLKTILLALTFRYLSKRKLLTVFASFLAIFLPQLVGYAQDLLRLLLGQNPVFYLPDAWTLTQAVSLLALIPIFLYNGKKGKQPGHLMTAKALQWGFYLFYPLHMLLLYLIT